MDDTSARWSGTDLRTWIRDLTDRLQPRSVMICDGSVGERESIERELAERGALIELDGGEHAHSFLYRSHGGSVDEAMRTWVCCEKSDDAGPNNVWLDVPAAEQRVGELFDAAMRGRTMYVVPCLLGPVGSKHARAVVQVTDSPFAVLYLRMMTRMGRVALERIGTRSDFLRGVHCLRARAGEPPQAFHFPERSELWTVGAELGATPELGLAGHTLRSASVVARREGWLAESMAVVRITSPSGVTHCIAAALAAGCGKTSLAMLAPTRPGWRVELVADDVCWLHPGEDGRLWAIDPTNGIDVRTAATNTKTQTRLFAAAHRDAMFVDCALRRGRRVWWPGLSSLHHGEVIEDARGRLWISGATATSPVHARSRLIVGRDQYSAEGDRDVPPAGVPISAIVFGGRRPTLAPLVFEALDWRHGVYIGASTSIESEERLHEEPMAIQRFCGYNVADYFAHWLRVGKRLAAPPKVFHVNWFRQSADGRPLWPGFEENMRVIEWMFDRLAGRVLGRHTPIGVVPHDHELDVAGLDVSPRRLQELLEVDRSAWAAEAQRVRSFLGRFGTHLPTGLFIEHRQLLKRLLRAAAATN